MIAGFFRVSYAPHDWPNSYVCVTAGRSDISKFTEGSLRTVDVSLRSSLLRDVSREGTSASDSATEIPY